LYDVGAGTNEGRVYIFLGGSIITENASAADIILTAETINNTFGYSLTSGDFNADGLDDLVVGATGYDVSANEGRVYIFLGGSIITENASGADIIFTGEAASNNFGNTLTTGDFNSDGKDDLVVGAYAYTTSTGRVYVFYGGSMISENASGADVTLTGETTSNYFGSLLTTGDFNHDGRDDLSVGANGYTTFTGRNYIFYGGNITTENASGADVVISGNSTNDSFGYALATFDYNADGREDLVVGAPGYTAGGNTGRLYFYETRENYAWDIQRQSLSDGLRVDPLMGYEMKITGEATGNSFGNAIALGDLNNDGKADLIVGAPDYNSSQGRVYIFYNDGSYGTKAGRADVTLTGEVTNNFFGGSLAVGDVNADGKEDLVVGAKWHPSVRAYIFYNDTQYPTVASNADVIITGESDSSGVATVAVGDFNADGKTDIVLSAPIYSSSRGRAYILYNDGSYPTAAASADVILAGEGASDKFGHSIVVGDFNADGKDDLAISAYTIAGTGKVYIFYVDGTNNFGTTTCSGTPALCAGADADIILTGAASAYLGYQLDVGDFNTDGKDDIAVGGYGYSTNTGQAYIFYGGTMISEGTAGADITLTGEATSNYFGRSLTTGDWNADGKDDVAVGAYGYNSYQGRTYIFYGEVLQTKTPPVLTLL
jgi:hypothetical protein